MTTTRPGWPASRPARRERVGEASGSLATVGRDPLRQHPPQRDHARLGAARRQHARVPGAEAHQPDAAGAAHAEAPEHERRPLGDVGLQPARGSERHRRRHVEHDPGRQRPLGNVQADVRTAGAGARGGVDVADVVAGLVRAQLGELGAEPDPGGAPVARQRPGDQPGDAQIQRLDQRRGIGPGPWRAAGGVSERFGSRARSHPVAACRSDPPRIRRSAPGSETAASTRSSSSSTVTPSLSAS